MRRPAELNLSNWRQPPYSRWAFHHVGEIIPTQVISRGATASALERALNPHLQQLAIDGIEGNSWSLQQWLEASSSDALLVAHRGRLVHEWYAHADIENCPHIVFSVSKSITAALTGVLLEQGLLDTASRLEQLIPELAGSGFAGASLQQLLDMQIAIDFEENYEASSGKFIEYRTSTGWHPCALDQIDVNLHDFLCSLSASGANHGETFAYKSPNSDLLGWILERASGESLSALLSRYLWQPMGAEADACITLDRKGAPRSAGGICVRPRDLLRFGELMRLRGQASGQQVVPAAWVDDCSGGGDSAAWLRSENSARFAEGNYRNQWYQSGNEQAAMLAIGIHSQWIYIDPISEVTIVKLSAQDTALNADLSVVNIGAFSAICEQVKLLG